MNSTTAMPPNLGVESPTQEGVAQECLQCDHKNEYLHSHGYFSLRRREASIMWSSVFKPLTVLECNELGVNFDHKPDREQDQINLTVLNFTEWLSLKSLVRSIFWHKKI